MNIDDRRDGERRTLALAGELTIYAAAEAKAPLLAPLLAPLADCGELVIDLAGVSEIDSAGLQLLLLVRREAVAAGRPLAFADASPAVAELVALYGLDAWFAEAAAGASA